MHDLGDLPFSKRRSLINDAPDRLGEPVSSLVTAGGLAFDLSLTCERT